MIVSYIKLYAISIFACILFVSCNNETERIPNFSFYETGYVAHARYQNDTLVENSLPLYKYLSDVGYRIVECDVMFTKDNVPVLSHISNLKELARYPDGTVCNSDIKELTYDEISKLNFSRGSDFLKITNLEEIIKFAHRNNICVQLDLKGIFTAEQCKMIYDIVSKAGMLDKVIWEVFDENFETFSNIDKGLVYQLDGKWSISAVDNCLKLKNKASLIILSQWFENFNNVNIKDYDAVISYGHQKGFVMKCATVNDSNIAKELFNINVDLIVTDCLK